MIILVIFIMIVILGTSYALWQITLKQSESNIITSGCFKVEFSDKNPITLSEAYPITDSEGLAMTPYEFTLTNTCSSYARYQVNLEILDTTTLENHDYVKVMYNENNPQILSWYEKVEKTLDNAMDSHLLETGYLEANDSRTFNLRLWLSEDTPTSEEFMNKTFESRVTITTSYANKLPGTLRTITSRESSGMWEYKNSITKLVIQNKLNKIDGAIKVSDESEVTNESIMSYVVPNEDGETYTAYLQGQDIIYLNPDSSYLFASFDKLGTIEGCRYLNTANVTNMANMFYNCKCLTNIDVSNFDTSKVTNMSAMFWECNSLTSINLSNFDTSNVTIMNSMFRDCYYLEVLNLNNFDTKKVKEMTFMFYGCNNLTTLELTNFDTNNVTSMGGMFDACRGLTRLDLSNFDTSKVTDMSRMFNGCRSLTNITYGDNFVYGNSADTKNMFTDCPANKPTHSSWSGVTF